MIQLRIAEGCGPTGRLLQRLLLDRNIEATQQAVPTQAVVCWGTGYNPCLLPSLNRNAGRLDKYQQLLRLSEAQVRVPLFYPATSIPQTPEFYPMFARQVRHAGGRDIRLCLQPEHAQLFAQGGWSFFTKFVPLQREFRVWSYRRGHLGTYEKLLSRPEDFLRRARFGCNYDNGYSFRLLSSESIPEEAKTLGARAVDALGLDFGASDILLGKDGQFYVLEVNSAPGVESGERQVIQGLADKIAYWATHDFPRRNGDTLPTRTERSTTDGRSTTTQF